MSSEVTEDQELSHPSVSTRGAWARAFFSHPSQVSALIEIIGALAIGSALPLLHWPSPSAVVLVVAFALTLTNASVRVVIGDRLPRWTMQIDVALGNLCVTAICAAVEGSHVPFANLYLLFEVFSLFYLTLRSALGHLGVAGAAYAVVLGVRSPLPGGQAVLEWLSVFGTGAVLGAVVAGLVGVLRSVAREDPLTGAANRRSWDERLDAELERSLRSGGGMSVVMLDLDGFKAINDAHGHNAGDRVLQATARSLQVATRGGGDFVARLGGDEFAVLAPGAADELDASNLAHRLLEALPDGVSASLGMATWDHVENASSLIRRADQAMYCAKRSRRKGEGAPSA